MENNSIILKFQFNKDKRWFWRHACGALQINCYYLFIIKSFDVRILVLTGYLHIKYESNVTGSKHFAVTMFFFSGEITRNSQEGWFMFWLWLATFYPLLQISIFRKTSTFLILISVSLDIQTNLLVKRKKAIPSYITLFLPIICLQSLPCNNWIQKLDWLIMRVKEDSVL